VQQFHDELRLPVADLAFPEDVSTLSFSFAPGQAPLCQPLDSHPPLAFNPQFFSYTQLVIRFCRSDVLWSYHKGFGCFLSLVVSIVGSTSATMVTAVATHVSKSSAPSFEFKLCLQAVTVVFGNLLALFRGAYFLMTLYTEFGRSSFVVLKGLSAQYLECQLQNIDGVQIMKTLLHADAPYRRHITILHLLQISPSSADGLLKHGTRQTK
jgi:hypothetical protein